MAVGDVEQKIKKKFCNYKTKKYYTFEGQSVAPEVHGPEGEVELEGLCVHIAEGCAEHGKAVEGDDAIWRIDHEVL